MDDRLKSAIYRYIKSGNQSALQLYGNKKTGKTYFIKNDIIPDIKKIKKNICLSMYH